MRDRRPNSQEQSCKALSHRRWSPLWAIVIIVLAGAPGEARAQTKSDSILVPGPPPKEWRVPTAPNIQTALAMANPRTPTYIAVNLAATKETPGFVARNMERLHIRLYNRTPRGFNETWTMTEPPLAIAGNAAFVNCKDVRMEGGLVLGPIVIDGCGTAYLKGTRVRGGAFVRRSGRVRLFGMMFDGAAGLFVRDCFDGREKRVETWRVHRAGGDFYSLFGKAQVLAQGCTFRVRSQRPAPAVFALATHMAVRRCSFSDLDGWGVLLDAGCLGDVAQCSLKNVSATAIHFHDSEGAVRRNTIEGVRAGQGLGRGIEMYAPAAGQGEKPAYLLVDSTAPSIEGCADFGVVVSGGRGRVSANVRGGLGGIALVDDFEGTVTGAVRKTSRFGVVVDNTSRPVTSTGLHVYDTMGDASIVVSRSRNVLLRADVRREPPSKGKPIGGVFLLDSTVQLDSLDMHPRALNYSMDNGGLVIAAGARVTGKASVNLARGPAVAVLASSFDGELRTWVVRGDALVARGAQVKATLDLSQVTGVGCILDQGTQATLRGFRCDTLYSGGILVRGGSTLEMQAGRLAPGGRPIWLGTDRTLSDKDLGVPAHTEARRWYPFGIHVLGRSRFTARETSFGNARGPQVWVSDGSQAEVSRCSIVASDWLKASKAVRVPNFSGLRVESGGTLTCEQSYVSIDGGKALRVREGGTAVLKNNGSIQASGARGSLNARQDHCVHVESGGKLVAENNRFKGLGAPKLGLVARGMQVDAGGQAQLQRNWIQASTDTPMAVDAGGTVEMAGNRLWGPGPEGMLPAKIGHYILIADGADVKGSGNEGRNNEGIDLEARTLAPKR